MTQQLTHLREQIDGIDRQIVGLLNQRAAIAREVGASKQGQAVYRPAREAEVLQHVLAASDDSLGDEALAAIYREIIAACRNLQQPLRVAYLGPEGTYSEEAARQHYGSTSEYLSADSIDETVHVAEKGGADIAVVPVENSTEGAVGRTLDLLLETPLQINGEAFLPIHHQLLTHAANEQQVTEIVAHPQALAQCRAWLDAHVPTAKRTAATSNGEAARLATNNSAMAAIASRRASHIYKVPILAENIEDDPRNTTRFLALGTTEPTPTGHDKTSLVCSTANEPGALHALLDIFAQHGINIVKLESRPAQHKVWDYVFYMDIDGHRLDAPVATALQQLEKHTRFMKIMGSYPKATA